ncbi:MAG: TadE/TadG family type IV pilus assembly protein [Chloroflexota bacterium]
MDASSFPTGSCLQWASPTHRRRELGQAIVEFALILPVTALLVMLGLDFSRVMHDRLILLDAARAGAQTAAAIPNPSFTTVAAAVVAEAPDLPIAGDAGHVQVRYPGDGTAVVVVNYGFQAITPLVARTWGSGPLTVQVSASWPLTPSAILPTPVPTPSAQPTITPTAIPTATPTITPIPTSTATPVLTATPTRTPIPVATLTATPNLTATPTVTAAATPAPTATATAMATAIPKPVLPGTPTPQPGCAYSANQSLTAGQGYFVVISVPAGTTAITAGYKAPSTKGAVQIYLYTGGATFAGDRDPVTLPPPAGSIASALAAKDTAVLTANVVPGQLIYTVYFYTTDDARGTGQSVTQTIGCSNNQGGGGNGG